MQNDNTQVSKETLTDGNKEYPETLDHEPQRGIKLDYYKKQGWGFKDTYFELDPKRDCTILRGNRYMFSS